VEVQPREIKTVRGNSDIEAQELDIENSKKVPVRFAYNITPRDHLKLSECGRRDPLL
jgi:hypothetical protein